MDIKKTIFSKKFILIAAAVLVVLIAVILVVINIRKPRVERVGIGKITDEGWTLLTDVLDHGGAAMQRDGKQIILFLGKNPGESPTDYRLMDVEISREVSSKDEVMCVINIKTNEDRAGAKTLSSGETVVSMIENSFRPLAVYRLTAPAGTEVVELRVDGESARFTNVFSSGSKIIKR